MNIDGVKKRYTEYRGIIAAMSSNPPLEHFGQAKKRLNEILADQEALLVDEDGFVKGTCWTLTR